MCHRGVQYTLCNRICQIRFNLERLSDIPPVDIIVTHSKREEAFVLTAVDSRLGTVHTDSVNYAKPVSRNYPTRTVTPPNPLEMYRYIKAWDVHPSVR